MEVKIDKRFDLPVSLDQAWALLQDVHATASCMPGAEITEQLDSTHFNGRVHIRYFQLLSIEGITKKEK